MYGIRYSELRITYLYLVEKIEIESILHHNKQDCNYEHIVFFQLPVLPRMTLL